ncbi:hypothetical protein M433DRAFT_70946 [Acidomyces richmondensis BFW]|nr:MAG: hypothetical protein FE78DRAFT_153441 [Acidomyces sp. 'richmondensis']KYG43766.1 hypothetical protein M433DRAFT_70946 [Acidomyces richmondensis BFW]
MKLLDLPVDVLLLIFPYLDAPDFLNLTASCKALHEPQFVEDAQYWSAAVRNTFRVPNQPVVEHDGARWLKLYKRLFTQSRIYTWGSTENGCLGHSLEPSLGLRRVSWPGEMEEVEGLGIISDVQCGGWSTSLLTAKGALYSVGVMDGLQGHLQGLTSMQRDMLQPTPLRYPAGFTQPHERYDPHTAIKQFSAGRTHLLAVSDSGRIWSWQNIEHAALHVKFLHFETKEGQRSGRGTVRKVVAGWNKSAALVEGTGIVIWEPLQRGHDDTAIEDAALVLESAVVPNTNHRQAISKERRETPEKNDVSRVDNAGEVVNFIVLENVVLFNTSIGKVFAALIIWNDNSQRVNEPVELTLTTSDNATPDLATDIQGSFRSFAVFTRSGAVLTSTQDRLMLEIQRQRTPQQLFTRIPALQHRDVISVAFGDYHFHALHSPGYITSYGHEPRACGALGLGGDADPEGRLRGIRYQGIAGDGRLVPHAYTEGRRVWFEHEKRDWIKFLTAGGVDPQESAARMRMALGSPDVRCQGEVSEWVEQQGRDWESKFNLRNEDDDGLGAYFALSVTAAGSHSGALVLVNEDLAEKVRLACEYVWANDHFPRLRLSDGTEMPGTVPFDEWRYGQPKFDLEAGL